MRKEIRIAGFGGQGVILAAFVLGRAISVHTRMHATMTQSYGPESRGGACEADVVIGDTEIDTPVVTAPDILVFMSQEAATKNMESARSASLILSDVDLVRLDEDVAGRALSLPFTRTADGLGRRIVANMVMLGSLTRASRVVPREAMEAALSETVKPRTRELNLKAFDAGMKL
ncbi:MAG TPA: 2-oxoacid:acceptor oxidoreductase family protein [Thermoplasmata archaeon]|nr:2-oxoacid:acceptor oxidoreductase family protein [Thermoplasmata archaeon]